MNLILLWFFLNFIPLFWMILILFFFFLSRSIKSLSSHLWCYWNVMRYLLLCVIFVNRSTLIDDISFIIYATTYHDYNIITINLMKKTIFNHSNESFKKKVRPNWEGQIIRWNWNSCHKTEMKKAYLTMNILELFESIRTSKKFKMKIFIN